MGSIQKLCERMRYWCDEGNLGYDQSNRWDIREGGECDCSSLVIFALREAGFDTGSSSYTGDMSDELCARGWNRIPADIGSCQPGDILLNDIHHVCVVVDGYGYNATIAQASIDENGNATGGMSGEQANETNTKPVYVYWAGWDCILRYAGSDSGEITTGKLEVDGVIGPLTVEEWQRQLGTTTDAIVSGQIMDCRNRYPALTAVSFEGNGSELMLKVQKILGVSNPTGIISSGTIAHLQGWLYLNGHSCAADKAGYLDVATAKSLQESLNAKEWENAI